MSIDAIASEVSSKVVTIITSIISIASVLAGAYLVMKRYMKGIIRQPSFTMTKSELENLLSETWEISEKREILLEKRLMLVIELKEIPKTRIEKQKAPITREFHSLEIQIKDLFDQFLQKEGITAYSLVGNEKFDMTQLYYKQNFYNALELVLIDMKVNMYGLCDKNIWDFKDSIWMQEVERNKDSYWKAFKQLLENRYKQALMLNQKYTEFMYKVEVEFKRSVSIVLNAAREEAENSGKRVAEIWVETGLLAEQMEETKEFYKKKIVQKYIMEKVEEERKADENFKK
jgi:hypothetical protein